jgi:hypothetical protein
MHDQPIPDDRDPAEVFDERERDALYLLTRPEEGQPLWSLDDLGRAMERDDIIDSVRGLHRAGLIHKTMDGYVFATRPAVRMVQMVGHVI